jgi:hypothetical protein
VVQQDSGLKSQHFWLLSGTEEAAPYKVSAVTTRLLSLYLSLWDSQRKTDRLKPVLLKREID